MSSARPPPSSSVVSRWTRQLTLRGPNRLRVGSISRPAAARSLARPASVSRPPRPPRATRLATLRLASVARVGVYLYLRLRVRSACAAGRETDAGSDQQEERT